MNDICVILTTVDSRERGLELAHHLVETHLAACVSVIPGVTSVYPWEGAVHEDPEWLLMVKTHREKLPDLRRVFADRHPYTVPEFIVLPSAYTAPSYAAWLRDWLAASPSEKI